jgi:hypothetical protein
MIEERDYRKISLNDIIFFRNIYIIAQWSSLLAVIY